MCLSLLCNSRERGLIYLPDICCTLEWCYSIGEPKINNGHILTVVAGCLQKLISESEVFCADLMNNSCHCFCFIFCFKSSQKKPINILQLCLSIYDLYSWLCTGSSIQNRQNFYLPIQLSKRRPRVAVPRQFDTIHDDFNYLKKKSTGRK